MQYKIFYDMLLILLKENGVTEKQLSLALHHHANYVSRIMQRKLRPPLFFLLDVCEHFKITPAEFWQRPSKLNAPIQRLLKEMDKYSEQSVELLLLFLESLIKP